MFGGDEDIQKDAKISAVMCLLSFISSMYNLIAVLPF